jgi:hypothetical protein
MSVFKKEGNISKIIFGAMMIVVFALVFGPAALAQFTVTSGSGYGYGYGYGSGYGYGYGFGSDGGALGYRETNPVVNLGDASNFVILSYAGINEASTGSVITGNVGVSPDGAASITGLTCAELKGTAYVVAAAGGSPGATCEATNQSALLTPAMTNLNTAYTTANGLAPSVTYSTPSKELGGLSLVPGVYKFTGNATISSNLTLAGGATGVWVFQIPGTFTALNAAHVILSGGAEPDNVYWIVGGATQLQANTVVNGTILDQTGITLLNPPRE